MSDRYVSDRALPDKAIDLIDEGSARVRLKLTTTPDELKDLQKEIKKLQAEKEEANAHLDYGAAAAIGDKANKLKEKYATKESAWRDKLAETVPEVGEEDIAQIVAAWTGVPVSRLVEEETSRLLRMEEELHKRMVGQDEAILTVSQAVRRARAGLKDPRRPIGSFIFLGPTGVGKTELARALAEYMFGSEEALIKLDMSEFMERHTTARLVGSPPGYVGYHDGGQLTEALRRRPYSVILFDEIEKAHPEVFNMLLQILEDGRLSDAKGKVVNFANTVIIMTSNLGIRDVNQAGTALGFQPAVVDESDEVERRHKNTKEKIDEELKRMFRPEFLNRVDAVVVFKSLTTGQIRQIVDLQLQRLSKHLNELQIKIEVTDAAKDLLAKEGYDRMYGARPLRRVITSRIEDQLSEELLRGRISRGETVVVDGSPEGGLTFHAEPRREETGSEDSPSPNDAPA
jgi:ATP-dependent Clp protease ATP-binding subunit ClpC